MCSTRRRRKIRTRASETPTKLPITTPIVSKSWPLLVLTAIGTGDTIGAVVDLATTVLEIVTGSGVRPVAALGLLFEVGVELGVEVETPEFVAEEVVVLMAGVCGDVGVELEVADVVVAMVSRPSGVSSQAALKRAMATHVFK